MDEIKRKLELIDQQLTGSSYHRQIISTAPLIFVAAGLIVGIVVQNAFNLPAIAWLGLLTLFAAAAVVSFLNWKSEIGNWKFAYLAFACFFCLGGIRLAGYYQPAANDIRNFIGDESQLATVKGTILTEPRVNKNEQWAFAKFTHNDPSSSFYLTLNEAETTTGWAKVMGIIRVQVDEPVLDLKAGDMVQIYCWLDRFKSPHNPGQFDIAEYMKRNNVFVAASVKSGDSNSKSIELLKRNSSGIFTSVQDRLKKIANEAMLGDSPVQEQSQALLAALLLGYRTDIDAATNEAFRQTGLFHFISLSGMNFAILVGIIWWLCKTAGLMKPARAAVCTIAAVIFLLVVPPNAPAMRAGIMCTVFCASFFFCRQSNPLNSLSLAAIILLLIKPTELFEVSWQLSFASVLGIILFTNRIYLFLYERTIERYWSNKTLKTQNFFRIILKLVSLIVNMFAVTFAACLASSGILLYNFYTINYLTWLWTIIMSPLIALISIIGYLKIIIALVLPTIANFLGIIANVLSDWLIWLVKLFASWHISEVLIGSVPWVVIILYYGFILFAAYTHINRPLLKKAIVTAMFLAIILFLGVSKWQRVYRDNLIVTTLDVGHGQAILAQLPGGTNILFDAGSLSRSDMGTRVVTPFLRYSGIGKIDAVVIGHGDIDHINGIPEVKGDTRTKAVYASKAFFEDNRQTTKFLRDELQQIVEINNLSQKFGSLKIRVLWPIPDIQENNSISDNDKSVVTLIEYAGKRVLICSDIEKFAQREILRLYPDLKADVLTMPHHGSAKTSEPSFADKTGAAVTIASSSESSYEKGQVIGPRQGLKSYYTGKDGAITVHIDKNGDIKTDTFLK